MPIHCATLEAVGLIVSEERLEIIDQIQKNYTRLTWFSCVDMEQYQLPESVIALKPFIREDVEHPEAGKS